MPNTTDPRVERRKATLQRVARTGGPEAAEAKRILAKEGAAAARKAEADELTALPKSIAEAKGDARAFMKADMKRRAAALTGEKASVQGGASMEKLLRAQGLEPVR